MRGGLAGTFLGILRRSSPRVASGFLGFTKLDPVIARSFRCQCRMTGTLDRMSDVNTIVKVTRDSRMHGDGRGAFAVPSKTILSRSMSILVRDGVNCGSCLARRRLRKRGDDFTPNRRVGRGPVVVA